MQAEKFSSAVTLIVGAVKCPEITTLIEQISKLATESVVIVGRSVSWVLL